MIGTKMDGLEVVDTKRFSDERGYFTELYNKSKTTQPEWVQDNFSRSSFDVLRGLHFQVGDHQQAKLVRCVRGKIFDVAVDVRPKSDTFSKWFGIELDHDNGLALFVPTGFAHGFLTLSEEADVLYKVSGYYRPDAERGLHWNDPRVSIDWERYLCGRKPILHQRDAGFKEIGELENELRSSW